MLILASSVFGYSTNTIEIQAEQQNLTSFNGVYQTIAQPNPKTQVNKNSKAINKKLTYIAVFIEFNDSDSLTSYHLDDPECIANAEKISKWLQIMELYKFHHLRNTMRCKVMENYQ